ncbi:c-type cytochrome [Flammeovirga pacifica]|uniref:Cytochrome c domain-containing protein n=1 Tax=Flammeovirga pacifica TaxID=915059 RepID=A0A1S1YV57_FLAPC|nr:cytochrome c [Flammeovirga pacifica]OHX64901.1 hypothetical protein NH26_00350 [Flammeovirga pacifica]
MKFLSTLTFLLLFIFVACSEGDLTPQQNTTPTTTNPTSSNDDNDDSDNTNTVTYSGTVAGILSSNCTGCHGATNPRAGLSLHTFATAKQATENGNVLSRIRDANNPMPQGGLMSQENIQAIVDWAEGGFNE